MNVFNNKISNRYNAFIRKHFLIPAFKRQIHSQDWSLMCNNCTGGFIMHDLGQQFRTPTVNLFFPKFYFFDFCEHLSYYLSQELVEHIDDSVNYPVGLIAGDGNIPDIIIHFMHYDNFKIAKEIWDKRKRRVNLDNVFIMWTFAFYEYPEELYIRFDNLPFKNKVAFTNNLEYANKYDSAYYIRGFETEKGLGLISKYCNLLGKRYYDQFDYINWLNKG